jgi:multidrug resistance efflux pump
VSPYSFIWLVDLVAVIAILALTFNWRCQYRNVEKNDDGSSTNEQ